MNSLSLLKIENLPAVYARGVACKVVVIRPSREETETAESDNVK